MIMLSVIVPNYKAEKRLFINCIQSIISQDYQDYEVIIIDDGNSEKYRAEVYGNPVFQNKKINIIFQENQGVSAARNKGIIEAHGKYLTFVDADDILLGSFFAESVDAAENNNADMVIGCMINPKYYDEGTKKQEKLAICKYNEENRDEVKAMLLGKHHYIGSSKAYIGRGPVAKIIRSAIAKQISFDNTLKIYEDTSWNIDIIDRSSVICIIDRVWYGYNYVSSSASKGFHQDEIERSTKGMHEIYTRLNLENEILCIAYCEQCLLEYSRIMNAYFLNKNNRICFSNKLTKSWRMIHSEPWNFVLSRHFKGLDRQMNSRVFLYRRNIWLPIKMLSSKIKKAGTK